MRFGAVLVSMDWHVGFYLSRRVVLTVPHPGVVRAVSYDEFGKCKVFARNGVAVSCFEAMMQAAQTTEQFRNSIEMVNFFMNLPENSGFDDLCEYMERKYGAIMEDFEIKTIQENPDNQTNQQWRSEMENFDVKKRIQQQASTTAMRRRIQSIFGKRSVPREGRQKHCSAMHGGHLAARLSVMVCYLS